MEQEICDCEQSKQTILDFKCEMIHPGVDKLRVSCSKETQNFASPTPTKPIELPRSKIKEITLPSPREVKQISQSLPNADDITLAVPANKNEEDLLVPKLPVSSPDLVRGLLKDESSKLPDTYKTLAEFFDAMVSSSRLLSLSKKSCTFRNICSQVEILTKRKFLHGHLAQIKCILPEAVRIEKILLHDEKTMCMNPDMKITLLWDVLKDHQCQNSASLSMILRQLFRARLLDFFKGHPEGCDIPEEMLPEPFSQRNHTTFPQEPSATLNLQTPVEPLPISLHLPLSFKRQISQKTIISESEKTSICSSTTDENSYGNKSPLKKDFSGSVEASTPMKLTLTPDKLTSETPMQKTPKRSMPTPDDMVPAEIGKLQCLATKRSLNFSSGVEADGCSPNPLTGSTEGNTKVTFVDGGITKYLSAALRPMVEEEVNDIVVRKKSQTAFTRRQQMLTCLPDLFNMIRHIFQSANCSSITKQELVHKILSHNFDIVETSEVEEQLKLLEELAPDWICGRLASSGDLLYRIRKTCDPESIRARLVEAA